MIGKLLTAAITPTRRRCPRCDGRGYVFDIATKRDGTVAEQRRTCPECLGKRPKELRTK